MYYADLVKGFAIVTNKIVDSKSANLLSGICLCFFLFGKLQMPHGKEADSDKKPTMGL